MEYKEEKVREVDEVEETKEMPEADNVGQHEKTTEDGKRKHEPRKMNRFGRQ